MIHLELNEENENDFSICILQPVLFYLRKKSVSSTKKRIKVETKEVTVTQLSPKNVNRNANDSLCCSIHQALNTSTNNVDKKSFKKLSNQ